MKNILKTIKLQENFDFSKISHALSGGRTNRGGALTEGVR